MERVRHEHGHDHGGRDGKQPRDHAIAILAGIEMAFESRHVTLEACWTGLPSRRGRICSSRSAASKDRKLNGWRVAACRTCHPTRD